MQPHNHDNCVQTQLCAQLEFIQILAIVVVMMVMVVVVTCLLNHYRLSARSLLSRHTPMHRRHLPLANEGAPWSPEGPGTSSGLSEHQVYCPHPLDGGPPSSSLQRDPQSQRFQPTYAPRRFQPTYPYLPQSLIDLPPTISLSDGEEPPPYQGPCTLQLRDPEQQMELNRESVRAPPNRTVFDSHLLDPPASPLQASLQTPPPSIHSGAMIGQQGAPPAYSDVIGHYYHPTSLSSSHGPRTVPSSQVPPLTLIHGVLRPSPQQPGSMDNRSANEKSHNSQQV
ncbi:protein TMEPAI isoform X2 [Echeneis naucrates]|uniref:Protein TMEPAI-like n=1 Tax=Echeneis naucrates TaxID=173247 RepID=A0A665SXJ0_ECHNA|nr:protein TMEPAI-like isoform X2 [Echeneis naucrates]